MKNINLSNIPNKPGCYLFKDKDNNVIYVGKSKNLKNRIKQYFTNIEKLNPKTKLLVKNIYSFDFLLVPNEIDSLLTELNLIKKYNPKYNIKLKQTNTYPYLKIDFNPIRLSITRNYKKNTNSKYFGPFPHGFGAGKVKRILESIYPIGKCLNPNSNKFCINYQLGNCLGYCFKQKSDIDEIEVSKKIENFFNGNINEVLQIIKDRIELFSSKKMFEQAKEIYDLIPLIKNYQEKQKSFFKDKKNRDIVGYKFENGILSVAISFIRYGKLILTSKEIIKTHELNGELAIINYLEKYYFDSFKPHELISNIDEEKLKNIEIKEKNNPIKGMKKDLLNLAYEEASIFLEKNKDIFEIKIKKEKNAIIEFKKIIKDININNIEMVDISNLNGKNQVGVVVSYNNFEKNKNLYRKYTLEDGQNDYLNIYNVTYRHFRRKLLDKTDFPSLFIVDGKHQVKNAVKALQDLNIHNVKVIGLIKNSKHKTNKIFYESNFFDIKDEYLLNLLSSIQEEVHRFAINFFKNQKEKNLFMNI